MLDDQQIGRNLARLRGDMPQKDLAEAMRDFGFKWSQATVWSVEKGERPLRLTEAGALGAILERSEFLLTQPEPLSVVQAHASDVQRACRDLRAAVERYDDRRFQLASALESVPPGLRGSPYVEGGGDLVELGAHDVIDELYREIDAEHAALPDPPADAEQLSGHWYDVFRSKSRSR